MKAQCVTFVRKSLLDRLIIKIGQSCNAGSAEVGETDPRPTTGTLNTRQPYNGGNLCQSSNTNIIRWAFFNVETDLTEANVNSLKKKVMHSCLVMDLKPKGILANTLTTEADKDRAFGLQKNLQ